MLNAGDEILLTAWLCGCGLFDTDPWDDHAFVATHMDDIPLDEYIVRYRQISSVYGCLAASRFYGERRAEVVPLLLDQLRSAQNSERCAAQTLSTVYSVCDLLCTSNPELGGYGPCHAEALATLPEGCRWVGWEPVPDPIQKLLPGPRWLDRPFAWGTGSPPERHPAETREHLADHARMQEILSAYYAGQ